MGKRQKQWARTARENLLLALGSQCNYCGSTENLTFDCIIPCGHAHHTLDTERRICFYRRQHQFGNIQILCADCNSKKGATDAAWEDSQWEFELELVREREERQQEIELGESENVHLL